MWCAGLAISDGQREMDNKKYKQNMACNIIIPIISGAVIYYLISPEVIFVKWIDGFVGNGLHISGINTNNIILGFIRNYFLDMLWGYALVFALFLAIGNNAADLIKTFLIAFLFTTAMEIFQITSIAMGTFDVWDIVAMFSAEIIAVFIIKNLLFRRNSK